MDFNFQLTFWHVSLFRMSATDHFSMEAENRGSTEAEPRHVMDMSLVFMVLVSSGTGRKGCNSFFLQRRTFRDLFCPWLVIPVGTRFILCLAFQLSIGTLKLVVDSW